MAPNQADLQPVGPDDPDELTQLMAEQPYLVAQGMLRMLKVHWTASEILDKVKLHLSDAPTVPRYES